MDKVKEPTRAEIFAALREQYAALYSTLSVAAIDMKADLTPADRKVFKTLRKQASAQLDRLNSAGRLRP